MTKNNMVKLLVTMMVIELIIFYGETTDETHNNSGYGNKESACDAYCQKICSMPPDDFGACYAVCLLTCQDPPKSVPDVVKRCTSTCIQSTCSKYLHSGNTLLTKLYVIYQYIYKETFTKL